MLMNAIFKTKQKSLKKWWQMDLLDARKEELKTDIFIIERTGAINITNQTGLKILR